MQAPSLVAAVIAPTEFLREEREVIGRFDGVLEVVASPVESASPAAGGRVRLSGAASL